MKYQLPLTLAYLVFVTRFSCGVKSVEIRLDQARDRKLRGDYRGGGHGGGGGGHGGGGGRKYYYNTYYHQGCIYNNGNSTVCDVKKYKKEQSKMLGITLGAIFSGLFVFLVYFIYFNRDSEEKSFDYVKRVQACEHLHHQLVESSCQQQESLGNTSYADGWICDKCNKRHGYTEPIRRCEVCSIDVCATCEGDRPRPALVRIVSYNYGRGYATTPTWLKKQDSRIYPVEQWSAAGGNSQLVEQGPSPGRQATNNRFQYCEHNYHILRVFDCEELKEKDIRYADGWMCDQCSTQFSITDPIQRCNICNIDFCISCRRKRAKDCENLLHQLFSSSDIHSWLCDKCGNKQKMAAPIHRCSTCRVDVCKACIWTTAPKVVKHFELGAKVEANYRKEGEWKAGKITYDHKNGTFNVAYDDGDRELHVKWDMIRLSQEGVKEGCPEEVPMAMPCEGAASSQAPVVATAIAPSLSSSETTSTHPTSAEALAKTPPTINPISVPAPAPVPIASSHPTLLTDPIIPLMSQVALADNDKLEAATSALATATAIAPVTVPEPVTVPVPTPSQDPSLSCRPSDSSPAAHNSDTCF